MDHHAADEEETCQKMGIPSNERVSRRNKRRKNTKPTSEDVAKCFPNRKHRAATQATNSSGKDLTGVMAAIVLGPISRIMSLVVGGS